MRQWFLDNPRVNFDIRRILSPSYGFWRTGYQRALAGRLDSWANVLAYNFLIGDFKSIVPAFSLITNVGFDEFATNAQNTKRWKTTPRDYHEP